MAQVMFFTLAAGPPIEQATVARHLKSVKPKNSTIHIESRNIVPRYVRLFEMAAVLQAKRQHQVEVAQLTKMLREDFGVTPRKQKMQ